MHNPFICLKNMLARTATTLTIPWRLPLYLNSLLPVCSKVMELYIASNQDACELSHIELLQDRIEPEKPIT
jgi:hypothetical protein